LAFDSVEGIALTAQAGKAKLKHARWF